MWPFFAPCPDFMGGHGPPAPPPPSSYTLGLSFNDSIKEVGPMVELSKISLSRCQGLPRPSPHHSSGTNQKL